MRNNITIRKDGGVVVTYSGIVDTKEIIQTDSKIYNNPDHPINKVPYKIEDYSRVETLNILYPEIQELAAVDKGILQSAPNLLIAIVVAPANKAKITEIWHKFMGRHEQSGIFNTIEEAENWIKKKPLRK